jgi:hypothetical protein
VNVPEVMLSATMFRNAVPSIGVSSHCEFDADHRYWAVALPPVPFVTYQTSPSVVPGLAVLSGTAVDHVVFVFAAAAC